MKFGDQVLYVFTTQGELAIAPGYELYTYVVTANAANTLLSFIGSDSNFGYGPSLDDVSLVPGAFPNPNPSPVPEPSSALIAGAILGVCYLQRRRTSPLG